MKKYENFYTNCLICIDSLYNSGEQQNKYLILMMDGLFNYLLTGANVSASCQADSHAVMV